MLLVCPPPAGEYWDALSYEWDGTPAHNQDAHRQRTVNWWVGYWGQERQGSCIAYRMQLRGFDLPIVVHAAGASHSLAHATDAADVLPYCRINAAGGLSTAFDITLKGIMHAGGRGAGLGASA